MLEMSVLILCRGNITRSPFIAGYLNHLYRNSELAPKIHLDIDSSGVEGRINKPVHPKVLEKGYELGFDLAMYRSKHADLKALEKSDLIITTDLEQLNRIEKNYPHLSVKSYHYYEFLRAGDFEIQDLKDPSIRESEHSFEEFFQIVIPEVERIWNHIASAITRHLEEGQEFSPKIFWKDKTESPRIVKPYNFFTRRTFPLCPYCQSKRIRRTKRIGFLRQKIYPLFNGYPYHCGTCDRDMILYIGSEINVGRRRERKQQKWREFLETETTRKKQPEQSNNESKRARRKPRELRFR